MPRGTNMIPETYFYRLHYIIGGSVLTHIWSTSFYISLTSLKPYDIRDPPLYDWDRNSYYEESPSLTGVTLDHLFIFLIYLVPRLSS